MEVRRVRESRVRRCEAVHIGQRPQFPARRSQGASATSRFGRPILSCLGCCESCALESGGREVCVRKLRLRVGRSGSLRAMCCAEYRASACRLHTCVQSILDGTLCTGHECVSHSTVNSVQTTVGMMSGYAWECLS